MSKTLKEVFAEYKSAFGDDAQMLIENGFGEDIESAKNVYSIVSAKNVKLEELEAKIVEDAATIKDQAEKLEVLMKGAEPVEPGKPADEKEKIDIKAKHAELVKSGIDAVDAFEKLAVDHPEEYNKQIKLGAA